MHVIEHTTSFGRRRFWAAYTAALRASSPISLYVALMRKQAE